MLIEEGISTSLDVKRKGCLVFVLPGINNALTMPMLTFRRVCDGRSCYVIFGGCDKNRFGSVDERRGETVYALDGGTRQGGSGFVGLLIRGGWGGAES